MDRNVFGISEAIVQSDAEKVLVKQDAYKAYIDTHIANVQQAAEDMFNNRYFYSVYNNDLKEALGKLKERVIHHDESKYSDEEFEPYRKHFYPISPQEVDDSQDEYDIAWKHHYLENDHHPEHWVDTNGPKDMPLDAILEMLCDWDSFKYTGKGGAKDFWYNNPAGKREKAELMTVNTVKTVERILNMME